MAKSSAAPATQETPDGIRASIRGVLEKLGFSGPQMRELQGWMDAITRQFEETATTTAKAIAERNKAAIGGNLPKAAYEKALRLAEDQARKQAGTMITQMVESEVRKVGETIAEGIAQGMNPRAIARRLDMVRGLDAQRAARLKKYADSLLKSGLSPEEVATRSERMRNKLLRERRETIARTEARHATSDSNLLDAKARGAKWKTAISTGDNRVSDVCQKNEAAGPVPIDEAFPSGDDRPPFHPNCRCTMAFVSSEDALDGARERADARAARTEAAKETKETKEEAPAE